MESKIELSVAALSPSESQPGNFTMVLEDMERLRRIPVIIGASEAQAIAMCLEKMQPPRPFTHDLMKNVVAGLGATLRDILIFQIKDEVFHTKLTFLTGAGALLEIEGRVSDAVALAVRFDAPVYMLESVVEDAAILIATSNTRVKKGSLAEYSLPELEALLQKLVEKEDFESASRIRDYLKRRKESGERP